MTPSEKAELLRDFASIIEDKLDSRIKPLEARLRRVEEPRATAPTTLSTTAYRGPMPTPRDPLREVETELHKTKSELRVEHDDHMAAIKAAYGNQARELVEIKKLLTDTIAPSLPPLAAKVDKSAAESRAVLFASDKIDQKQAAAVKSNRWTRIIQLLTAVATIIGTFAGAGGFHGCIP